MRSVLQWSIDRMVSSRIYSRASRVWRLALLGFVVALFAGDAWTKSAAGIDKPLPDGPGKDETQKLCSYCHDLDKSVSINQDRAGWQRTIEKMLAFGAKATDEEFK